MFSFLFAIGRKDLQKALKTPTGFVAVKETGI